MKTARGVSLVELLAVMSACTMIFSVSAVLIHRTMRAQSQTRYFFENERSALRLARQFRRDVHDATVGNSLRELQIPNDSPEPFLALQLTGAEGDVDRTIEYRRQPGAIERTVSQDGEVVSREKYSISSIARLFLREDDAPRRLVLTVAADPADLIPELGKPAPTIRDTPVSLEIVAVVARDVRFAATAAPSQEATP